LDTNVGLGRRTRLGHYTLAPLVGLFALATPLVGQAKQGPFYHVNYYQVRPGDEKAHDSALVNVLTPLFNEMVKRKAMVSYLLLTKTAGSGEYTNLTIVEVASPSSEGGFQRNLEAASQAVFRKSWSDATARLNELRRLVHTEAIHGGWSTALTAALTAVPSNVPHVSGALRGVSSPFLRFRPPLGFGPCGARPDYGSRGWGLDFSSVDRALALAVFEDATARHLQVTPP
jgi:hypothetical protein